MNSIDNEIFKTSGLVNRVLAPIRMRGVMDPIQIEADAADREYLARLRGEILDRSGNLERDGVMNSRNEIMRDLQNKLRKDDPIGDDVFKEVQKDKFIRNKIANFTYSLSSMSKNPGLVENVMNGNYPFNPQVEEIRRKSYTKKNLQDEFMERILLEEEERNIKKIRTAKDKMDAMNKIVTENPNMTKEQYTAVLSSLM